MSAERILSDLSAVEPRSAISSTPAADKWIVIPFEGEICGSMIWSPIGSRPPEVRLPLPDLGLCRIYIGMYASGEAPVWLHHFFGRQRHATPWNRLLLRLSDEDWFDTLTPDPFRDQPNFQYISESLWKTTDVTSRLLVLSPPRKEAFACTTTAVAYVRLVPVQTPESWPAETKRLVSYYDGNFLGHFVEDVADVKSQIAPLAHSDCQLIFWNTCREDTCFYPTNVGNRLPDHGVGGAYPHWMGRDMHRMLARGQDPLKAACDVAHACGLKLYASYRRLTARVAPHVFPLHPNAMLAQRHDLWCMNAAGEPIPHLSLCHAEVRQRMISLFVEQTENYDIDGIHLFFARGVPFSLFEKPFLDAFGEQYALDPRALPLDDRRVWRVRAHFFMRFMRELRAAMCQAQRSGNPRRIEIALTVMNSPDSCAYFGIDVEQLVQERLIDVLAPFPCHYLPPSLGEHRLLPRFVEQFASITRGTGVRLVPDCGYDYSDGQSSLAERAAAFYRAGADALQVFQGGVRGHGSKAHDAVARRLGHINQLHLAAHWQAEASRAMRVRSVGGFALDHLHGIGTCG